MEKVRELLSNMGIEKAVVVDDSVNQNQSELVLRILEGTYDVVSGLDIRETVADMGLVFSELIESVESGEIDDSLLIVLKEKYPVAFEGRIDAFVNQLREIFGNSNVQTIGKADEEPIVFGSETLLFLDYELTGGHEESEALAKHLSGKDTGEPRCIIFISSKTDFNRHDMLDPGKRSEYFRSLRSRQGINEYKNSLYDYIPKNCLTDAAGIISALDNSLQTLYAGQKFYHLLFHIEAILTQSAKEVLGKFHLLNARSIQELLREKVSIEGESEIVFLLNWLSRHIGNSIIRSEEKSSEIYSTLIDIKNWPGPFYELHEDIALKELLVSEMWDTTINSRYAPVDFGDVFEIDYNNQPVRAILLTQACTLAVRGDGKRSSNIGMLLFENPHKGGRLSKLEIEDWHGGKIIFDLDESISFPVEILDLTTINGDGVAVLEGFKTELGKLTLRQPLRVKNDSYKLMLRNLTSHLLEQLPNNQRHLHQANQLWIPYEVHRHDSQYESYRFPVKRLARLDQQYALHIFQKAQSWWGRIGLPVNVNFMDDYKEAKGRVNFHGIDREIDILLKRNNLGELKDMVVSVDQLKLIIQEVYNDEDTVEQIEELFAVPKISRIHSRSKSKFMSIIESRDGVEYLQEKGIRIKFDNKEMNNINEEFIDLEVFFCHFHECFLNDVDITQYIDNVSMGNNGTYKFDIAVEILTKMGVLTLLPYFEKRQKAHQKLDRVISVSTDVRMNGNSPLWSSRVAGSKLLLTLCDIAAAGTGDAASAKEGDLEK